MGIRLNQLNYQQASPQLRRRIELDAQRERDADMLRNREISEGEFRYRVNKRVAEIFLKISATIDE